MSPVAAALLADLVLVLHVGVVLFVVVGELLVLAGGWRGWAWVRIRWLRLLHLLLMLFIALQPWLGRLCPLTDWEQALRARAGEATYQGGFIAHWLGELLYVQAPWWVFVAAYSAFALLVVASWWIVPPRPRIPA
jgi:hypothetical protein